MDLRGLFQSSTDAQDVSAGTTIFAEGDAGEVMYVVLDGEVDVRVGGESVETVGPGGLVGEMALIDARARSATAVARSDCRIVPVDEKRFLFLVHQTPFFSLHVMRVLAGRLRSMDEGRSA